MSKILNTGFTIYAPYPVDSRFVVATYEELSLIPIVYVGLNTYVLSEDKFYIYKSTGWTPVTYVATAGSWGTIGGDITTQLDLYTILNSKFEKSGGNISGNTTVFGNITATNIILAGSTPSISLIYTTPPSTSNSAGAVNNISFDTNFFYICVNTNLWKRIPLLSW